MQSDVLLTVGGQVYGGWTSMRLSRSLEQVAGRFEVSLTERWADSPTLRPIRPGERCVVSVAGQVAITGYVDEGSPRYDRQTHTVRVSGRDATGDLVDCSAIHPGGEWAGVDLGRIARDLCRPFTVPVRVETSPGAAFAKWKIQEGETVYECLERAARIRAVLLMSDGLGGLVITRAGRARADTALVLGENVLGAEGAYDHRDRHSEYIVKGDTAGTDSSWGVEVIEREGRARDPAIGRYRPLVILAEDQASSADCQTRAEWERSVRYGRSLRVTYTVQGWTQGGGRLWEPNTRVPVRDPYQGIDAEMLISGVTLVLDEGSGRTAELTVTRPEAFGMIALPEPKESVSSWSL